MTTRLALANLGHYKARTAVAIAGVAFADLLIFTQLGFLGAVARTATIVYDALDFDIALRSPAYLHLTEAGSIPHARLRQAASLPEVQQARPFLVGLNEWQNPVTGEWRGIMAMGVDPREAPFQRDALRDACRRLTQSEFVLVDRESRSEYGPADGQRFSDADIGVKSDLGHKDVEIVGHFSLGTGLAANGAVLQNMTGYRRSKPIMRADYVSLGLIKLDSDASAPAVADTLNQLFGTMNDTLALTREEVLAFELRRWVKNTSLGTIFQLGVLVALLVGTAIVYQVLSTDVTQMAPEYATLKAMGYGNGFLASVVIQQAIAIGAIGFLPGLGVSLLCYRITSAAANIPVIMSMERIGGVFCLSILMCGISGALALRKLFQADPAELY